MPLREADREKKSSFDTRVIQSNTFLCLLLQRFIATDSYHYSLQMCKAQNAYVFFVQPSIPSYSVFAQDFTCACIREAEE